MSLFNQENIINSHSTQTHNISKYEFKSITAKEKEAQDTESAQDSQNALNMPMPASEQNSILLEPDWHREIVEKLLAKSDNLSDSLAKLEMQFEKLEAQSKEQVANAKDEGYKDGYNQAKEDIKKELEDEINTQKKTLIDSIITLENTLKGSQKHLEALEKELSAIAVDIAKEVIIKEVEENSQKVALALSHELLHSIMDATNIKLKVNPQDYLYLKEQLKDLQKVEILADNAVALGGVVVLSSDGNIDGNILNRYKNMKQSILENIKE
ncbi:flagellar assembly protein FliH [Helicobacter himalayensis]|uniref:flagellar assembly protein FliH n=1 Tax=Helicobacter himalayensis TaxID=1591088 RepID=UPI003D6F2410